MKQFFNKKNTAVYLLYALVLLLPYGKEPVVYCIVGLILDFLILKKWKNLQGLLNFKTPLLWMMMFYFFICISMFWTQNMPVGWFELQQKLSLLIIPILVYSNKIEFTKKLKSVLLIFVAAVFLASCAAIVRGFYLKYSHFPLLEKNGFLPFYSEFYPQMHIAYFAFYVAFASILVLYFFYQEIKKLLKIIYASMFIFFLIPIYYLSSKACFLAYLIMLGISCTIAILKSNQRVFFSILAVLLLVVSLFFIQNNPRIYSLKKMGSELLHPQKSNPEVSSDMSNGQRIYVIKSSIEVIKNNFLFGVGAGDVIDAMEQQYLHNNYKVLAEKKLNCHNQFLESWVELGIIGFILFLLITLGTLIFAACKRDFLLFIFMIGFIIMANTESFLNHQAGVVFFTLFLSILVLNFEMKKGN